MRRTGIDRFGHFADKPAANVTLIRVAGLRVTDGDHALAQQIAHVACNSALTNGCLDSVEQPAGFMHVLFQTRNEFVPQRIDWPRLFAHRLSSN
jgi:hypothetical protein